MDKLDHFSYNTLFILILKDRQLSQLFWSSDKNILEVVKFRLCVGWLDEEEVIVEGPMQ